MLESKRRAIIFLTLSFLLAAAAGFLVLKKVRDMNEQLGQMIEIYVANTDIASRSLISPDQVTAKQIPKKFADQSYVTDKASLQNQVTVVPLSAGDIITKNIVKPATQLRDQNNRLVAVFASGNVIFDQELQAMDRVDIIISHIVNEKPVTEVFMKDVPVAMVAKSGDEFKGVALELPFDQVTPFIHQQHYASIMRILKANVGKGDLGIPQPFNTQPRDAVNPPGTAQPPGSQPTQPGQQTGVSQPVNPQITPTPASQGQGTPSNTDAKAEGKQ